MAASDALRGKRSQGSGWLATLLGILVLVAAGFALGLIVGVVSQEPELVVGHMAGRSTQVDWTVEPATAGAQEPGFGLGEQPDGRLAEPLPGAASPSPSPLPPVAASPPARSPAPPRAEAAQGRYAIQVGAFGDGGAAQALARSLRGKGYAVSILEPTSDTRWRVRVGPLASRGEAESMARRLKLEEQLPTWVLSEGGS